MSDQDPNEEIAESESLSTADIGKVSILATDVKGMFAFTSPVSFSPGIVGVSVPKLARLCHEANRAFCQFLGDDSQKPWDETPDNIRMSALDGVQFHIDNPDADESASHQNWVKFKEADGWVYGPEKDAEKKTHPLLVPFDQLPPEHQFKDKLFRTLVHNVIHTPLN